MLPEKSIQPTAGSAHARCRGIERDLRTATGTFDRLQRMTTRIRVASSRDREAIRDVYMCAFPEGENQLVATLAADLLNEETNPETISLVAEIGGSLVGHIAFSPVAANTNKNWVGYILAPLGVKPEYQKAGVGSMLIESGIQRLSEKAVNVVFVYGDPGYYGKFGFRAETAAKFMPPYNLECPSGWQATMLREEGTNEEPVRVSCVASLRDPALW